VQEKLTSQLKRLKEQLEVKDNLLQELRSDLLKFKL
jgi:hypothetical protein